MRNAARSSLLFGTSLLLVASCAELRQNLRGQELSYRGAHFCEGSTCKDNQLVASRRGTREGTTDIATIKLGSKAALAFTFGRPSKPTGPPWLGEGSSKDRLGSPCEAILPIRRREYAQGWWRIPRDGDASQCHP